EEENKGKIVFDKFEKSVEIKNVSFSYGENQVIKNLSLTVHKGEKVALVGLSGSGKSTLINLLLRLYNIEEGEILLDGKKIEDYTLESLRDCFALVSQDIFLFNDTIEENLKVGETFTKAQVDHALEV